MTIKSLDIDVDNFESLIKNVNSKEEAKELLKWTDNFLKETFEQAHNGETVLKIVESTLEVVRKLNLTEASHHLNLINRLGLMCHLSGNYDKAISFYLLGLLQSSEEKRSIFNHNIGDAMMSLGNLEDALHFLKAAALGRQSKDSTLLSQKDSLYLDKMYYFICLCLADKMDEAAEVYEETKAARADVSSFDFLSHNAMMIWFFKNGDEKQGREHYQMAIDSFNENKSYPLDIYEHNSLFLELCPTVDDDAKEKILKENIRISKGNIQKSFSRTAFVNLIDHYDSVGNEKERSEWLIKFFEFEKEEDEVIHSRLNSILIDEFYAYFNQINNVNELIVKQKDELQDITYILSHDLKTPMRTINSFSNLIEKKIGNNDFEDIDQDFHFLRNATSNVYHLIEDIGELNKVNKDEGPEESINLNEIVLEVRDGISSLLIGKNASIEQKSSLFTIKGKRSDFRILFQNIIENGIKYNESENPLIKIISGKEGERYKISFRDNGIGFDSTYGEQIFGFFKRLHSSEKYEGTGFGLGICRKIMNKYDGEIRVDSKVGEGATFDLVFPAKLSSSN